MTDAAMPGGPGHPDPELLSAYVDGNLDAVETAGVREHLLDCASCRSQVDDLRLVRDLMRALPLVEPPHGFYERTLRLGPRPRSRAGLRLALAVTLGVVAMLSLLAMLVLVDHQPKEADQSLEAMALDLGRVGPQAGPSTGPTSTAPPGEGAAPDGMPASLAGYAYDGRAEYAGDMYLMYRQGARRFAVRWEDAELRSGAFPDGSRAEAVPVADGEAWFVPRSAGGLLFVQRGARAYEVVVPPGADLEAIAASLPEEGGTSVVERVQAAGRALLETFGLGGG